MEVVIRYSPENNQIRGNHTTVQPRREYIPTQPSDDLILEIGAVILRNSRRLRFHLSSACLDKALFMLAAVRLVPG